MNGYSTEGMEPLVDRRRKEYFNYRMKKDDNVSSASTSSAKVSVVYDPPVDDSSNNDVDMTAILIIESPQFKVCFIDHLFIFVYFCLFIKNV